ncbi:alginate lyase family protein [Nocardia sp. NPDC127579]|uniref:alginate lyase family protein n=1 Tax=Nocardia sp. NPDC127579 TaxID=3345402 RepID=UPI0036335CB2
MTDALDPPLTFALYRIIGNDLPPRHSTGQTLRNLRFQLEHEKPFEDCAKWWVVNRIRSPEQEAAILGLLRECGARYLRIPFVLDEYARIPWDTGCFPQEQFFHTEQFAGLRASHQVSAENRARRLKINYLMNVNGARNTALAHGRDHARWILPWDGNCFVHEQAWRQLADAMRAAGPERYCVVPMARLADNDDALSEIGSAAATEEPQIAFRADAAEEFSPEHCYGYRNKIDLLIRLGVPGRWDVRHAKAWDLADGARSPDAGRYLTAGWVYRLDSGHPDQELGPDSLSRRSSARGAAINAAIDAVDRAVLARCWSGDRLTSYDPESPTAPVRDRLERDAAAALSRGVYSVLDKSATPPSGDSHDYFSPAPLWTRLDDGTFVRHDGIWRDDARLYSAGADRFDRTRAQRLFDDTTVLALAWRATGRAEFAEHGARLVRTWFVDPATRMTPHLRYAQWKDEANQHGIIEFKDLYYFLDAVRLLERSGHLAAADRTGLRDWLARYLEWLMTDPAGQRERRGRNNHGVYFDLQTAAIAAFLGDTAVLAGTVRGFHERFDGHFAADGSQPHELARAKPVHYTLFNLQGWLNLATLLRRCGVDLADHERRLRQAADYATVLAAGPAATAEKLDPNRLLPLRHRFGRSPDTGLLVENAVLHPYFGIKPYWFL